ncbi:hypothetical protein HanIR_Chr14g0674121 [Helianthus annuus]|nr:hypothetical protein HanIR_Chr14g0674121 [Helianthus annuus]
MFSLVFLVRITNLTSSINQRSSTNSYKEPPQTPVLRFRGWNTGAVIILLIEYTQPTLQSLKLFTTRHTKKERNLQGFKRRRERTLNGFLGFYKKWYIIENPARALKPKKL